MSSCRFVPGIVASIALVSLCAAPPASADLTKEREEAAARREQIRARIVDDANPTERAERLAETPCVGGLAGTYPCKDVDLLAFLPLSSIGGGNGNDVWGWVDPMTGREYALMGRTSGVSFVDVTDPVNPVYLGNLPPNGSNSTWRDIKVYADHAYVVSEASGHGMQVFDLTRLRNVAAPPQTFTADALYTNFGSAHNVAINEDTGFAYAVGTTTCSAGPHFVDLSVPTAPAYAGCHVENFYTHDTQCVVYAGPDGDHTGREICVNSNESRINVIDVTDHAAPTVISQTTYSGTGYVHQGWLTEDHRYWLQGDELDEQNFGHNTRTRIVDMTDLDAPTLIASFDHATAAIDHNLYTHNGYVYMANYRAGLRILDLADVDQGTLTEVAYFDVYPSSDSASFNGAWSVYPYFPSGTVVVSGIEQGLFVLRPNLGPLFRLDVTPAALEICAPDTTTATVDVSDRNGYTGTVTLATGGLPAGASASFDVNPVVVPGSSTLTLDVTTAAPGSYAFTVGGDDGTLTDDHTLQLEIADQLPGQPLPTQPADGAIDVPRQPVLSWNASAQAMTYELEIATDPGFANVVYAFATAGTMHIPTISLDPLTLYHWRVRATNPCGGGSFSATSSFTTIEIPEILVVDDDDNSPDVLASYTDTLLALGRSFDVWDTANTDNEPNASALGPYDVVIWFSGDEYGGACGPGSGGEQALATWLDDSGCLLISSQDYYYDRGLSALMQSHLGVSSATSDVTQTSADGDGSVFGGLGPYTLSFPYSNWTDTVLPDGSAETSFTGNQGSSSVDKDTGVYRSSFWSFGLETLPTTADRETALGTFLAWCDGLPALDGDGDGAANEGDCAPSDATVWAKPTPARALTVSEAALDNLSWTGPLDGGATAVSYDVLRSASAQDLASASCMESGDADTVATDTAVPPPGGLFYYVIRVRNGCGSTLGDAPPRAGATCP